VTRQELKDRAEREIVELLGTRVHELYRQKEVEFPVMAAMLRHMTDRVHGGPGGARYDREGLYRWAVERYPESKERLVEEDFRTQSRQKLLEKLLEVSKGSYPPRGHEAIDEKVREEFEGSSRKLDESDAKELSEWAKAELKVEVPEGSLVGRPADQAREALANAFDLRYRPEMRQM